MCTSYAVQLRSSLLIYEFKTYLGWLKLCLTLIKFCEYVIMFCIDLRNRLELVDSVNWLINSCVMVIIESFKFRLDNSCVCFRISPEIFAWLLLIWIKC